jgi:phosphate:Na+ symporter
MVKLTNENLAFEDECTLSSFHRTLNDILRIAEIGDNVCKYTKYMVKHELEFSSNVMVQLGFMKNKINLLYAQTDEIFMTKNLNKMNLADALEEEVDQMRKDLIDDHFDRLNRGECKPQNSGVFVNLVNNLERAADHMIYIAYSVKEAKEQAKNK